MDNSKKRLILLLGGARAGKSSQALWLAEEMDRGSEGCVYFIATAQALDDDMSMRINRHRGERPPHWRTIEEPYELGQALSQAREADVVIVDCLTLLVSNWLLRENDEQRCDEQLRRVIVDFLHAAQAQRQTIICVSNEVGLGIVPETRLGRVFRDSLGRVNDSNYPHE